MSKAIIISVLLAALSLPVTAQSFNPILEENAVDGLLLGAEGSYTFFGWLKPSLGLAYGLQSQKIRYKAGLSFWDVRLGALDWPRTPVLGRIGEAGVKAMLDLSKGLPIVGDWFGESWWERELGGSSRSIVSGFFGTLWPWTEDPNPPEIAYIMWESHQNFSLPFGIELGFSQQTLQGWWQLGVLPSEFRYSQTQLSLRRELLSLSVRYGTLKNESKFPDFIFVQSVKGESSPLKGEQFWAIQFERAFDVIAIPMPIPLLPQPLELLVRGAVFFQVASAGKTELPSDSQGEGKLVWQNRLSWGLRVLISLGKVGAQARADFVFTRDGQFHFLFNF